MERVERRRANMVRGEVQKRGERRDLMTEADSSGSDPDGRDHVRRIPDIISLVKDSYGELRPAERRVADVVLDDVK